MKASVLIVLPVDLDPSVDGDVAAMARAAREAGATAASILRHDVAVTGEPAVIFAATSPDEFARLLTLVARG